MEEFLAEPTKAGSIEFTRKEMERYGSNRRKMAKLSYHPLILRNILEDDIVLDVGCGTASRTAELVRNKRVYCIGADVDRDTLGVAKRETRRELVGTIEFVVADANLLPFKKGSLKVILFYAALHHLPYTWRRVLKEAYRLLNTQGKLILREPCSMNPFYYLGTRILRSNFGLLITGDEDKQRLARYDEGQIAFRPDELVKELEETGFRVEKEHFIDFLTTPLIRAASKSLQPYRSAFKLLAYVTKPLDYVLERTPKVQKYCSYIVVVCNKRVN